MKKRTKKGSSQMEGIVDKKILLIVCIIILILIPILILLSGNPRSTQKQIVITESPKNTNAKATTGNTLTAYHGNSYTLSYPNGWNKTVKELSNSSGTVLDLQPSGINSDSYSTITVEVLNAQTTSINTLTRIFTLLHYTETNTAIAGVTALKYTAVLPTQNGDLHSMAYIFQHNEKIYTVKLEYIQTNTNEQLEDQFSQLLNSFSLQ